MIEVALAVPTLTSPQTSRHALKPSKIVIYTTVTFLTRRGRSRGATG